MNNKRQSNTLFTMLMLVIALLVPQWGGAQEASKPTVGDGTVEAPFELGNAEQLKWFADYVNGKSDNVSHPEACAKLIDDIDMSSVCHAADDGQEEVSWTPISNSDRIGWGGTFDGNNKTISNLYVSITYKNGGSYAGLFGKINGGCAKNIVFQKAKVVVEREYNNAGILAGKVSKSTIQGITTDVKSVVYNDNGGYSYYTGGVVGEASNSDFKKCENHAKVNGYGSVGGICGYFDSDYNVFKTIVGCANYRSITGKSRSVGGICGTVRQGGIEDCANYAAIESSSNCVGGIVGFSNIGTRFKNVFSNGNVTGVTSTSDDGEKVGIIVGYSYSSDGEELIAYGKESTLTINGKKVEARAVGYEENGTSISEHSMAFTNDEIKSGKVAYLLNNEIIDGTQAWYQKLGDNADAYPILTSTGDNTIYKAALTSCDAERILGEYANKPDGDKLPHNYEIAGHPDANGLYGDVCINCNANNENVKYIQHFCGILGNNLKLTYDNGKYYAEAVTLTDGEAYNSPVDIEVADFKYIRTFDAYKWQPLYVPFRMSLEQLTANGLSVATPENIQVVDETVTRLNVNKLKSGSSKANYPSLIMSESDGEKTIELADVTLSAAKEGFIDCWSMTRYYYFNGVYQANKNLASNSEDAINYIMKDGGLVLRNDDDVPAPQSWYMNVKIRQNPFGGGNEPLSSDAKTMPIYVIGEGYATGIENIDIEKEHTQQGIYDMQGRKLSQEPESGIYIKDGKKYVK